MLSVHRRYAWYIARHKWFVLVAGLRTRAPLWRLLIHDWSKFLPCEWAPYARRFFRGDAGKLDKSGDPDEFHRAWLHHWHVNAHHWEHWLTAEGKPLQMPEASVREMVADWMGAGRAITGQWDVVPWYEANAARIVLHPATRQRVAALIDAAAR